MNKADKIKFFLTLIILAAAVLTYSLAAPERYFSHMANLKELSDQEIQLQIDAKRFNIGSLGLFFLLSAGAVLIKKDFRKSPRILAGYRADLLILLLAALLVGGAVSINFLLFDPPKITQDAAVFEHGGWYILEGARPYLDFWDSKPPLVYLVTSLLALLAGGKMEILHILSAVVNGAAVIGIIYLSYRIASLITDDPSASLLGALVLLIMPGFYTLAARGFHPKYLMLLLGLLGLYLELAGRVPMVNGILIGAATFFWLPGLVFLVLILSINITNRNRNRALKILGGFLVAAVIIILPVLAWGVVKEMLVEVVLVPFSVPESQTTLQRLASAGSYLGLWGTLPIFLGISGTIILPFMGANKRTGWWLPIGGLWFLIQMLLIDFDGYPDLFPTIVFAGIGMGLLLSWLTHQKHGAVVRNILTGLILIPLLSNAVWWSTQEILFRPDRIALEWEGELPAGVYQPPEMVRIFWLREKPDRCHYRLSEMEVHWMAMTNQTGQERTCGQVDLLAILRSAISR